jgi:[protein-PII] uridylyltransferase
MSPRILQDSHRFELGPADLSAEGIRSVRERITSWWCGVLKKGDDALIASSRYTTLIDTIISNLFKEVKGRAAVFALGGYGRSEMGPYSDVDLLFLHDGEDEEHIPQLTSSVLYPLWDAGFEAGGAARTIQDCGQIIADDAKTLTSMLDARLVAGDAGLADEFHSFIKDWFSKKRIRRSYVRDKFEEHVERKRRFGDSIYLLQPNVKEGEGGLRDFHSLVWLIRATYPDGPLKEMLGQAGLSQRSLDELFSGLHFSWRVRQALHLCEGRKQDRLIVERQDDVARMLGFENTDETSAAEALMKQYYRSATLINRHSKWAMERMSDLWSGISRKMSHGLFKRRKLRLVQDELEQEPLSGLRAFVRMKKRRISLATSSKEAIAAIAPRIDHHMRSSGEAKVLWRELFKDARYLGPVLAQMHECGYLERWFPEMRPMLHHIPHDGFHVYTVDVHTIHAVTELTRLMERYSKDAHPVAARAMRSLRRPHIVLLAALLHDIGKGQGGSHQDRGAELAKQIVTDLGFSKQDADEVQFLVRSHMLMPKLAFQRDINDPRLIKRFAQTVRTPQMLSMLYLVTFADLRSVGPHLWSNWKEGLLDELYLKTRDWLSAGGHTEAQHKKVHIRKSRDLKKIMGKRMDREAVDEFIDSLPKRYLLTVKAPLIATHFAMVKDLSTSRPVLCDVRNDHDRGVSELSVVTCDASGLFAKIAGTIAAHNLSIVEAELYTTKDDIAVDIIRMTDVENKPLEDPVRWRRILDGLSLAIKDLKAAPKGVFRKRRALARRIRENPPRVEVDNDVSAAETIVEIHADDEQGLLYRIATAIAKKGFAIDRARILTHVDRVVDVFYIRDEDGGKISSGERLGELKNTLLGELKGKGKKK